MGLARLIAVALFGWAAGPDPASLIVDLSSPKVSVRAEAAGALEELGRPALPALYRARDSHDPGLLRQVEPLIDLIERQRLLRATKVRLDFEAMSLPSAVESLRAQTGFPVVLDPDDALRARRVTLHATKPVAFWESLDRLGAVSGVRYIPGAPSWPAPSESTILLGKAEGPPVPASDSGPFRFYLVRLARHREVILVRPPAEAKLRESLAASLHLFAEPGLAVNPIGPVVLEEVVDDRGRDLRPDPPIDPTPPWLWTFRFEDGCAGQRELLVPLKPIDGPVARLRRLKGHIPITVITRTGDPIIIPLAGAQGKTFARGGIALSVTGVSRIEENMSFKLTIRGERNDRQQLMLGEPIPLGKFRPPYRLEDYVQVQNDQGRPLWWNTGSLQNLEGGELEAVLTVYRETPARVLYHGVIGAATELGFEFTDVPLP